MIGVKNIKVDNQRLVKLMKERGYSQKVLAEKTHLTESAISRYIKGDRTPNAAILMVIADALSTTTEYLNGSAAEIKPANTNTELENAYAILARNVPNMTAEEKARFATILFGGKNSNEH